MISEPWIARILVVLFAGAAFYCVWQLLRPESWRGGVWRAKVAHIFHLLMCISMLAMIQAGTPTAPYALQAIIFTVGALWFASLAIGRRPQASINSGFLCVTTKIGMWYHTAMMAAMVWMAVLMTGWMTGSSASATTESHHGHDHAAMEMTGVSMSATEMSGQGSNSFSPQWAIVIAVLGGVIFFLSALLWLRRYFVFRKKSDHSPLQEAELLCETAMALGMGIMYFSMA